MSNNMSTLPESIRAIQIQENKTVAVVTLPFASQDKVQNLPQDEVLIRVRVVGLNPSDWKVAFTDWGFPGAISGCDVAGDIVAIGSEVKHLKVGDRACALHDGGSWKDNGGFSEYVRIVAAACFALPPDMTYEEGASFPVAMFTSVQSLFMRLSLPKPLTPEASVFRAKGERILIWGGSTACGHHAIQLAALSGLEVYATASPTAHDELKALGASQLFDYKDPDVVAKIQATAADKGVIYGVDCVCEKGSTESTIDSISPSRGGKVMVLLPVSEAMETRRKDVVVDLNLAGTLLGREITVAQRFHRPAMPEDKARILEWCTRDVPRLLEGWKAGIGAPIYKPQRLRSIPGGLDGIPLGMRIMQEGAYGREKLVCKIA